MTVMRRLVSGLVRAAKVAAVCCVTLPPGAGLAWYWAVAR